MVSRRAAKSEKYGPGRSGSGNGRFDKGLNSEIDGFWECCQIQKIWSWNLWVRNRWHARWNKHLASCTKHHAPSIMHHAQCTLHHAPCTLHLAPRAMHHAPNTMENAPCTMHHSSCTMRHALCIFRRIFFRFMIRI